ncbi:hypothetical protein [Reinekea blandensis]|nr:hypothetical protein [Reinekea blandensis]
MKSSQQSANYLPDHGQNTGWGYRFRLWFKKIRHFFSEFFIIYDQDKFNYELTFWEKRSELAHYLGERRRKEERGERLNVDPLAHLGYLLIYTFMAPFYWYFFQPLFLLTGAQSWVSLPPIKGESSGVALHKVDQTKRQSKARLEGTAYGMEKAAMLCQCDGHRLFLNGNAPLKLLFVMVSFPTIVIGIFGLIFVDTSWQVTTLFSVGFAGLFVLCHFPIRHGVIFDRDAQTAMLIRGWFRKPLVVPFDGIFFTSYTEDVRNFSKDLIMHSQYVPKGRKKPIRLALNTGLGSTGYSMAQVVGAVDCFMDKNNTQAMPLSIKHSIEWHRKHKLTLWHLAWRPLPEDELPKYTAADSLYQADLLDPKDKAFKFQLTAEGREVMRKEDLLNRYLKAVWEAMSVDAIDAELKQAAEAEFGIESLEKKIREQTFNERHQSFDLLLEICEDFDSRKGKIKEFSDKLSDLRMKEKKVHLSYIFDALTDLNKCKEDLLSQNEISYEQYLNSFKHAQPTPKSELMHNNIIKLDTA